MKKFFGIITVCLLNMGVAYGNSSEAAARALRPSLEKILEDLDPHATENAVNVDVTEFQEFSITVTRENGVRVTKKYLSCGGAIHDAV